MNTRQKLTLGIAAIFMVTLTVIGVTYAYFVTRISYTSGTATAQINTAEIGAAYNDNDSVSGEVKLDNVLPGSVVYQSFAVFNKSEAAVPYSITLATKLNAKETVAAECTGKVLKEGIVVNQANCESMDASTSQDGTSVRGTWVQGSVTAYNEFIHNDLVDGTCSATQYSTKETCEANSGTWTATNVLTDTCYKSASSQDTTECFVDDEAYNNIIVQLWKINYNGTMDSYLALDMNETITGGVKRGADYITNASTAGHKPITVDTTGNIINLRAPYNATKNANGDAFLAKGNEIELTTSSVKEELAPRLEGGEATVNYYLMRVEYVNVNKNQNIENNASVSLKVDITSESISN